MIKVNNFDKTLKQANVVLTEIKISLPSCEASCTDFTNSNDTIILFAKIRRDDGNTTENK